MLKHFPFFLVAILFLSSIGLSQSFSQRELKVKSIAPRIMPDTYDQAEFYTDFRNRQIKVNRIQKTNNGDPVEFIVENWDWPANSYFPAITEEYDFTGDGALDPILIATGNTLQRADGSAQRYTVFGYIDDFGVSTYQLYGFDNDGIAVRTGWNSHLILDEATGKAYCIVYDFLNSSGNINNHVWEIDLATDPAVATQLTDSSTALEGGWPRVALDGNGNFWMSVDIFEGGSLGIAVSTDGGHTFTLVDSCGSNDSKFWVADVGSDPIINANGDKISFVDNIVRGGGLDALGIFGADVSDPDSADELYHWYSTDGGGTWWGEGILFEGTTALSNRPDYQISFSNYDVGSQYVDPMGVTHVVMGGVNSAAIFGEDTINVFPLMYYNDKNKVWMSLEIPAVETYGYDFDLGWGNADGPGRPVVKTDATGQVVVVMWNRPQFTGEAGNSDISVYDGTTDYYNYDIVYAYSTDGGVTWSTPEIAYTATDQCSMYPNIGGVEINEDGGGVEVNDVATVHYVFYWDKIPGSYILGQNELSTDNVWYYNTLTFDVVTSVSDGNILNSFKLEQNYPNPFNPTTRIDYSIPERTNVTIKVFDILGKEVTTLVNGEKEAGGHHINFDASNLASGLYIYSINAGDYSASKKMMLLK